MTYAFSFDARYCSGCKACQAACKDKNNLPTGVLWRRVYEVTGGSWQQEGEAWTNSVFAYNLSVACNHCIHPKCAGVCPTHAYTIREDGIVVLDSTKCVGCGYCAWACPYAAPQYDAEAGYMSKCDFCFDNLERGLPPACVAACPLRVLDQVEMEHAAKGMPLWDTSPDKHPFPLPGFSHTEPRLAITPHPAMSRSEPRAVANGEEIHPHPSSNWDELPLMIFTLLTQLAVGGFWAMSIMFPLLWSLMEYQATGLWLVPLLVIGASLGIGMLASFAHLGTKRNAWRVLSNLGKSSLSKEILFSGLFGLGWLFTTLDAIVWHHSIIEWSAVTSILGIGLIYNMSQVYRFRAAPGWNSWRTNVAFFMSALLLGLSSITPLLASESNVTSIQVSFVERIAMGCILFLLVIQLTLMRRKDIHRTLQRIRVQFIIIGIVTCAVGVLTSELSIGFWSTIAFLVIMGEESIGRWIFYASRLDGTQAL